MPDQDSLTKDPTQKLPLLCRCGCTDHSSVQRCCQVNEYYLHPCVHPCVHTWSPLCSPAFTPVLTPASLCTPGTPRATRAPSPSGQAKNGFARAHIIPGHVTQSKVVPSALSRDGVSGLTCTAFCGVCWHAGGAAGAWHPGCKLPFAGGRLCLPLNICPWAPSP